MCRGIGDLTPMFPIGQRTAHQSLNFGYINGEILRRVDGRTIAQFLQDEICKPLKIDGVFLGVPDRDLPRVAVLTDGPPAPAEYDAQMVGEPAGSYGAKVFNRRDVQQAAIPGSGGIMSARGLAPEARIRAGIELQSFKWDEVYRVRVRRSLGYRRGADTGPLASPEAFGHVGGGGSFGNVDPVRRLAIGSAKNYFTYAGGGPAPPGGPARPAGTVVTEVVFDALNVKRGLVPRERVAAQATTCSGGR